MGIAIPSRDLRRRISFDLFLVLGGWRVGTPALERALCGPRIEQTFAKLLKGLMLKMAQLNIGLARISFLPCGYPPGGRLWPGVG